MVEVRKTHPVVDDDKHPNGPSRTLGIRQGHLRLRSLLAIGIRVVKEKTARFDHGSDRILPVLCKNPL